MDQSNDTFSSENVQPPDLTDDNSITNVSAELQTDTKEVDDEAKEDSVEAMEECAIEPSTDKVKEQPDDKVIEVSNKETIEQSTNKVNEVVLKLSNEETTNESVKEDSLEDVAELSKQVIVESTEDKIVLDAQLKIIHNEDLEPDAIELIITPILNETTNFTEETGAAISENEPVSLLEKRIQNAQSFSKNQSKKQMPVKPRLVKQIPVEQETSKKKIFSLTTIVSMFVVVGGITGAIIYVKNKNK
jgi:hypothetical protein